MPMVVGMSGYRKGTRKPKSGISIGDISIGGIKIPPALAISVLMAALYSVFLIGSRLEKGLDLLILSAFSVLAFAMFSYLVRSGSLAGLRPFNRLLDAFMALSALTLLWDLLVYFQVIDTGSGPQKAVIMSLAYAVFSLALLGLVLYFEKGRLRDIFVKAGSWAAGAGGFVLCVALGIGILYFLFGGSSMSTDKLAGLIGLVLIFSVLSAAYEEIWFRGLMLSRLMPLVGDKSALIIQAAVFGIFEAAFFYTINPQPLYLPVVFIVGTVLGYYWGLMTMKDESLMGAALFHAGFYVLIGLPMLAALP
jgi:membrane protease YdiL (CAAX protease family)